jgi:hypothetical protein
MKKTAEERHALREERNRENAELEKRFPYARLCDDNLQVILDPGDRTHIRISSRFPGAGWKNDYIGIYNPYHLSEFIEALVCRYNSMVADMNGHAVNCSMLIGEEVK